MNNIEDALKYIENTGGSPNYEWFIEDAEPIGEMLYIDLFKKGYVYKRDGKINLTEEGQKELERIKKT